MNTTQNTGSQITSKTRLSRGRQWIAINNIEWPVEVQPRAGIDMEWVRQLSEFRKEGSEFPSIKVFQMPDGKLIGAEGHHRSLAMFKADETDILCDVVDGTIEDAIVYAAGSNRSNGVKPMGSKDVTKAVEMLLAVEKWWNRTAKSISKHVGCSSRKVISIRNRISIQDNRSLPKEVENLNGRTKATQFKKRSESIKIKKMPHKNLYTAHYRKQKFYGTTPQAVQVKIDEAIKNKFSIENALGSMRLHGFSGVFIGVSSTYKGMSAYHISGIICLPCDFIVPDALPLVIGRLIAARRYKDDLTARMVVLCYPENGPQKVIDLYKAEGFEFLTPEELAESLKATGDPEPPET